MIGASKSIRYWQQNDGARCKTDEFEIGKLNQLNFKYDIASIWVCITAASSALSPSACHGIHFAHWTGTKLTHRMCSTYSCLSINSSVGCFNRQCRLLASNFIENWKLVVSTTGYKREKWNSNNERIRSELLNYAIVDIVSIINQ